MFAKRLAQLTLMIALFFSAHIQAQDSSEDIIKYRQYLMSGISTHFKSLRYLATGRIHQPQHWLPHARALSDLSQMLKSSFPEGSDFGNTEAKENIWENKADFNQKLKALETASQQLFNTLQAGEQNKARQQIKKLGQHCKSCHKKYREL